MDGVPREQRLTSLELSGALCTSLESSVRIDVVAEAQRHT